MKIKNSLLYISFSILSLSACNDDHNYVSNDPDAAPSGTLSYYDVNDLSQNYSMFYKPSHGWVGDPMPFYENGTFHVFYLQDTRPAPATFHPWYKATTADFLSYTDDGEMIPCGADNSQEDALGTGSVFKNGNIYYAFYTAHNGDLDPKEFIYLATSSDLKAWTKQPSFSFRAPDGYDRNEFRDPFILKEGNEFKMLVSTRADIGGGAWKGVIAQFKSNDLLNWEIDTATPFFYIDDNEFMVECADVFTENGYQYIIYSGIDSRLVHYKYRKQGVQAWTTPANNALDGITFYAAKTASDGTSRYLFGWAPTRTGNNDSSDFSWGGSLVVHQLNQNSDGTLSVIMNNLIDQKLVNGVELKITGSYSSQAVSDSYTLKGTETAQDYITFDRLTGINKIKTTIKPSTATKFGFEFGASGNRREVFALQFDTEAKKIELNKVLRLDGTSETITSVDLPISSNGEYNVTLLIENSVCVLYVNDQIAFTNRIYAMNQNAWGIISNNGDVTFSNVKIYK